MIPPRPPSGEHQDRRSDKPGPAASSAYQVAVAGSLDSWDAAIGRCSVGGTTMSDPERFLPSRHGFAFSNAWPSQPAVVLSTHFGQITIGNAAAGLCGGMVFVALDYWHAAIVPPTARPSPAEPLYRQIVQRLIESWNLPAGVARYYECMTMPDGDTGLDVLGRRIVIYQGLARRTVEAQWPQIRADLDRGVPAPLGVVTVASPRPADLALNHQVLAYDYDRSGAEVSVRVYDPNRGQRDDIWIRFDDSRSARSPAITHNLGIGRPVRGFFRTAYAPAPIAGPPSGSPSGVPNPASSMPGR